MLVFIDAGDAREPGKRAEQQDDQHQTVADQETRQGHDERREPQASDQGALYGSENRAEEKACDDGRPPRPFGGDRLDQLDCDRRTASADVADRQVDLTQDERKPFGHREHHEHGALLEQVDQVPWRQVEVAWADRLKHQRDDHQADDDREHAAVPAANSRTPCPDVFPQGLRRERGRKLGRDGLRRRGQVGRGLGVAQALLMRARHRCGSALLWSCTRRRSDGQIRRPCPARQGVPGRSPRCDRRPRRRRSGCAR